MLASDEDNLRNLIRIKPANATAEVRLWGSYLDKKPIQDPYYGGMVEDHCRKFTISLTASFSKEWIRESISTMCSAIKRLSRQGY